jgi:hypothetical protein
MGDSHSHSLQLPVRPVTHDGENAVKPCKRRPASRGCCSHLIRSAPARGRLSRTAFIFSRARCEHLRSPILAILIILEQWLASSSAAPFHWLPPEARCRRIGNSMINSCLPISFRCFSHASVAVRTGFGAFTCTWRFLNTWLQAKIETPQPVSHSHVRV